MPIKKRNSRNSKYDYDNISQSCKPIKGILSVNYCGTPEKPYCDSKTSICSDKMPDGFTKTTKGDYFTISKTCKAYNGVYCGGLDQSYCHYDKKCHRDKENPTRDTSWDYFRIPEKCRRRTQKYDFHNRPEFLVEWKTDVNLGIGDAVADRVIDCRDTSPGVVYHDLVVINGRVDKGISRMEIFWVMPLETGVLGERIKRDWFVGVIDKQDGLVYIKGRLYSEINTQEFTYFIAKKD